VGRGCEPGLTARKQPKEGESARIKPTPAMMALAPARCAVPHITGPNHSDETDPSTSDHPGYARRVFLVQVSQHDLGDLRDISLCSRSGRNFDLEGHSTDSRVIFRVNCVPSWVTGGGKTRASTANFVLTAGRPHAQVLEHAAAASVA